MDQRPQLPQIAVDMFDPRLSNTRSECFKRPNVREDFLIPDAGVLTGLRFVPKLDQDFFHRLFAVPVFIKLYFKHHGHFLCPLKI